MKMFLVGALVGIAFAALTQGCATSVAVLSGNTESQPMRQEDEEEMQEMLYPDPNQ